VFVLETVDRSILRNKKIMIFGCEHFVPNLDRHEAKQTYGTVIVICVAINTANHNTQRYGIMALGVVATSLVSCSLPPQLTTRASHHHSTIH
jgi:hypothetical protein